MQVFKKIEASQSIFECVRGCIYHNDLRSKAYREELVQKKIYNKAEMQYIYKEMVSFLRTSTNIKKKLPIHYIQLLHSGNHQNAKAKIIRTSYSTMGSNIKGQVWSARNQRKFPFNQYKEGVGQKPLPFLMMCVFVYFHIYRFYNLYVCKF